MLKILEELYDSREAACIYSNYEKTDSFHVGVIVALNNDIIALKLISPYGKDDGIEVFDVEDIFRVETGGKYLEKIKKLCTDNSIYEFDEKIDEQNIIKSVLSIAYYKREIVSVELVNSGYTEIQGFVESINDDECNFKQIDDYGYENGTSYVKISNITQISYAREEEKRILKLWETNNTEYGFKG